MVHIYYKIWADAILSFKKHNPEKNWKYELFLFMSFLHGLILAIIVLWLEYFNLLKIGLVYLDLFPGELLNKAFSFLIEFVFPPLLVNYFLILYGNKYRKIIKKYPDTNKLALNFTLVVSGLTLGSAWFIFIFD